MTRKVCQLGALLRPAVAVPLDHKSLDPAEVVSADPRSLVMVRNRGTKLLESRLPPCQVNEKYYQKFSRLHSYVPPPDSTIVNPVCE
jgi:hypothetical protein